MTAANYLYITDHGDNYPVRPPQIIKCKPDGSNPTQIWVGSDTGNNIRGCWYNHADDHIYWVFLTSKELYKVKNDGTGTTKVADLSGTPIDLCGNSSSGIIYYTDSYGGKIYSINTDGTNETEILSDLSSPFGIAIRPQASTLYFTEFSDANVYSCDINGNNKSLLVSLDGDSYAIMDIEIDFSGSKLVYSMQGRYVYDPNSIRRCNFDGSDDEEIVFESGCVIGHLTIDEDGGYIYSNRACGQRGVQRCSLDGSDGALVINDNDIQMGIIQDICSDAVHPLETLPSGDVFYVDGGDNCPERISRIVRCGASGENPSRLWTITTDRPLDCWYNNSDGFVYWIDFGSKELWKVSDIGTGGTKVADLEGSPVSLCGNSDNNVIYYADFTGGAIRTISTDGSKSGSIITGLTYPNGICIRPASGFIYFTQTFNSPNNKISRCTLTGEGLVDIALQATSSGLNAPRDIGIDLVNNKLIYSDQYPNVGKHIFRCNFDGTESEPIVDTVDGGVVLYLDVDASGGKIYYSESCGQSGVWSCGLDGSDPVNLVTDGDFEVGIALGVHVNASGITEGSGVLPSSGLPIKNIRRFFKSHTYHYPTITEDLGSEPTDVNIQLWSVTSGTGVPVTITYSGCTDVGDGYWRWDTKYLPWETGQYSYHYFYRMVPDNGDDVYGEFIISFPGYNQHPDGGFIRAN